MHSPDPFYQTKVEAIKALKERVQQMQGKEILLSLDDLTGLTAAQRGMWV